MARKTERDELVPGFTPKGSIMEVMRVQSLRIDDAAAKTGAIACENARTESIPGRRSHVGIVDRAPGSCVASSSLNTPDREIAVSSAKGCVAKMFRCIPSAASVATWARIQIGARVV